ncbi:hypothetical protein SAMN05421684_5787 [Asanoa ishikariensis]|uniref:PA14 domain-containing protein n=1 Tax=Asanoa ishikariensis TaxID=137265 RepID=A0A1H3TK80_9ACTN|nr:neuraminidase-like domain-containing protein [Asanoa ishikariensis]SDZ49779.1 hypothetical protein SAMN05421684_5787 [Asanoa ishikariensis]
MPLIVIRLHPTQAIVGDDFTPYLTGLTIEAFDLTVASPLTGVSLGVATYRAPTPTPNDPFRPNQASDIVQHWAQGEPGFPGQPDEWKAVATAVLLLPAAAGPEHTSRDLRLVIRRGTNDLVHRQLYFNVPVDPRATRPARRDFPDIDVTSLYLALPPPGAGADSDDYVELPRDGSPPSYTDIRNAMEAVLAGDPGPGNPPALADLTPVQARHIAYEIIWNQAFRPLPGPDDARDLDAYYTLPDSGGDTGDEIDRATFEGELESYYARANADAERLAPYVYAVSAAVRAEALSTGAAEAGFLMPVSLSAAPTGSRFKSVRVVLASAIPPVAALQTPFTVPAPYFYALGAMLPTNITAENRYRLHTLEEEGTLRVALQAAVDAGVIAAPAAVNVAQAARRLRALGATEGAAPRFATNGGGAVQASVRALVQAWLGFTDTDVLGFWAALGDPQQLSGHLELVLRALTLEHQPLIDQIKLDFAATRVAAVDNRTEAEWTALFTDASLLPPFTAPGDFDERTATFVRHAQRFFAVTQAVQTTLPSTLDAPPVIPRDPDDLISVFAATAPGGVTFGQARWSDAEATAFRAHIATMVADEPARAWLWQAVSAINELAYGTDRTFALMEALYARGFTSLDQIAALPRESFRAALTGTVAWADADDLHDRAGGQPGAAPAPGAGPFRPVNDGRLVNCVPPPHRSPLGPVAYLYDLLQLTEASTCEGTPEDADAISLRNAVSARRGDIGDLAASRANAQTPIPVVDLVNECLESVVAGGVGAVYDTNATTLGGHSLADHDPAVLFAALPEHSTPATPVANPAAYERLRTSFAAPSLPYAQSLDIVRTYLGHLRTSRFAAMRRFRATITELAIDPDNQPGDFQAHLWRYPVTRDLAAEYLGLSPEELRVLLTDDIPDEPRKAGPALYELYGFPSAVVDEELWTTLVVGLPEFLARTGLSWCEFRELWQSGFVRFSRAELEGDEEAFPDCEPCDLGAHRITFLEPESTVDALRRLAVFVRLWRKLRYSFGQLRDLTVALGLFRPDGSVDRDFVRQLAAFQLLRDEFGLTLTDPPDLDRFVGRIAAYARDRHSCEPRAPRFVKLLADNLDPLSALAGFDPAPGSADRWDARPSHVLRFAEVLAKIYASDFGVGELLFLFTADPHLDGDDPFPLQPANEALDDPFALPDDRLDHSLWTLRERLLAAAPAEADGWTWDRVGHVLRERFGFDRPDELLAFGAHFFPRAVGLPGRSYRVPLAPTSAPMWNTPPGPFRYDGAAQELVAELPLSDAAVIGKLRRIRQLTAAEQQAVRELYVSPRADLAPFAFLFEDFGEAQTRLVEEPDESARWSWFQGQFALFHQRCELIAEHLAAHVAAWTGQPGGDGPEVAWTLLRHLYADENAATAAWERDGGQPPAVTWPDRPGAGAFAALLGLVGTGLLAEYTPDGGALAWRDVCGPARDDNNSPVPTVIPAPDLAPTAAERVAVDFRNGYAVANTDGAPLGGAEGYAVRWTGVLLVEADGPYTFEAGSAAAGSRWLVTLQRGQRRWSVLSHDWPDEPGSAGRSAPLHLTRGAYRLRIDLVRPRPAYRATDEPRPAAGGFTLEYAGPDTGDELVVVPRSRLFLERKDGTLADGIDGPAAGFLRARYVSSVRDIRRTYQRAFGALLFAHRFGLSARPLADDGQSELGYLLAHPDLFAGASYYRAGAAVATHRAYFDPNLLPLLDTYGAADERSAPSARRRQALFDWWERTFDATALRRATANALEPPVWLLFHEAAENHPDLAGQLQRHMRVDARHVDRVLTYVGHAVTTADLADERWATRVFHADAWLDRLGRDFAGGDIRAARPDLWAADDPGTANLTAFVRDGCLESGPPRRYGDVQALNDGLRLRGRAALLAQLGLDPPAAAELLLLDVEAGPRERTTRIDDAIGAVQAFVRRARIGLEPGFTVSPAFARLWDRGYHSFRAWEACARRRLYPENWVDWTEIEQARRGEGFRFLEHELRRRALTRPRPGGLVHWTETGAPGPTALQVREPSHLRRVDPRQHGLDLRGTPDRQARPAWLAAAGLPAGGGGDDIDRAVADRPLPWWVRAAIRVGVRFVRVAAAGDPPAAAPHPPRGTAPCCTDCAEPPRATVDEYYFWLLDARFYRAVRRREGADEAGEFQVADDGNGTMRDPANPEASLPWSWHDPNLLPRLLRWEAEPAVRLAWCRVHDGEFTQLRRSAEELRVSAPDPELVFTGREDDSLRFTVQGGIAPRGYAAAPPPGFRYDLATDTATPVPEVLEPPAPAPGRHPGDLDAFPFFAFHDPGAPILPLSPHAPAVTVAASLRAHCRYEAALRWYELVSAPLRSDNAWPRRARDADVARTWSILLSYLETLDEWGGAVLRADTDESAQQARVLFEAVSRVLGPAPRTVPAADEPAAPGPVVTFVPAAGPLNPRLLALYERNADRLRLVHAGLDARRLRPGPRPASGPDAPRCPDDEWCAPDSGYRFTFLIQRAQELAGDLRSLGAALLAAYEKGDAEYLTSLRATHERQVADLNRRVRQSQWRDADWQLQALRKSKEIAQTRLRHLTLLIQDGTINREEEYLALAVAALALRATGNIAEGIAQGIGVIPDIYTGGAGWAGSPVFVTQMPIGTKLAGVFSTVARIANSLSELSNQTGGLRLTQGGWERREDEWRHQVELLDLEIPQIERQLLAAERRRDVALHELNNSARHAADSAEVHDFLRDRFTAHQRYLFLQQDTAALHQQTYELALHAARQAERALSYEQGHTGRTFVSGELWDDLQEGLQAGERLAHALRRMEHAYLDGNVREYELTKHVSLRLHFPLELLTLRSTGRCELELPEWLFDQDYPGHYLRRVKSVSVTVAASVGQYAGVHCRLTLLSGTTRVDPRLRGPVAGCCGDADACRCGSGYPALPDDPRVVRTYAATEAIATSSGLNDAGLFELNFRDERYLPFEFAGAVSRWRIELPPENNTLDVDELSDVVLHLNYTAREGGDALRAAAMEHGRDRLPGDGLRLFDVRRELDEAWWELRRTADAGGRLPVRLGTGMFPFVPGRTVRWVDALQLVFEAPPAAFHLVRFTPHGEGAEPIAVPCVTSRAHPGLFWGVVDLDGTRLGPVGRQTATDLGTFQFPHDTGTIRNAYVVAGYRTVASR